MCVWEGGCLFDYNIHFGPQLILHNCLTVCLQNLCLSELLWSDQKVPKDGDSHLPLNAT